MAATTTTTRIAKSPLNPGGVRSAVPGATVYRFHRLTTTWFLGEEAFPLHLFFFCVEMMFLPLKSFIYSVFLSLFIFNCYNFRTRCCCEKGRNKKNPDMMMILWWKMLIKKKKQNVTHCNTWKCKPPLREAINGCSWARFWPWRHTLSSYISMYYDIYLLEKRLKLLLKKTINLIQQKLNQGLSLVRYCFSTLRCLPLWLLL